MSDTANATRKAVPKAMRFEVFKRDKFTCQYCGAAAPSVVLECDHIQPQSKGGENTLLNLVTACHACNNGKSDKTLADDSVVTKQHAQMAQLQERREQLEMMLEWQRGLVSIDTQAVSLVAELYEELVPGWGIGEASLAEVRRGIGIYGVSAVMDMARNAAARHVVTVDGGATIESSEACINAILSEIRYRKKREDDPVGSQLAYILGIVRKRSYGWSHSRTRWCSMRLRDAYDEGVTLDELKRIACTSSSWTDWQSHMDSYLDGFRPACAAALAGKDEP